MSLYPCGRTAPIVAAAARQQFRQRRRSRRGPPALLPRVLPRFRATRYATFRHLPLRSAPHATCTTADVDPHRRNCRPGGSRWRPSSSRNAALSRLRAPSSFPRVDCAVILPSVPAACTRLSHDGRRDPTVSVIFAGRNRSVRGDITSTTRAAQQHARALPCSSELGAPAPADAADALEQTHADLSFTGLQALADGSGCCSPTQA